jgi:hypothetical protein
MMSAHKSQSNAVREVAPGVSFRVENDFYSEADALRLQVENAFLGDDKVGITPLTYVFSESCYQFLTASAESVFTTESLHGLVESLENWGQRELGTSHVSTPQVRVYIHGCERSVLQDAVMLGWHYMLSLTQGERPRKGNRVRIVIPDRPERRGGLLSTCDVVDSELRFNRLVVHDTQNAYGIETVHSSMNPLEGTIFLDGYLW